MSGENHGHTPKGPPWEWLVFGGAAFLLLLLIANGYAQNESEISDVTGYFLKIMLIGLIIAAAGMGIKAAFSKPPAKPKEEKKEDKKEGEAKAH